MLYCKGLFQCYFTTQVNKLCRNYIFLMVPPKVGVSITGAFSHLEWASTVTKNILPMNDMEFGPRVLWPFEVVNSTPTNNEHTLLDFLFKSLVHTWPPDIASTHLSEAETPQSS